MDWDPSKWTILILHYFGLASKLRRAKGEDIRGGLEYMRLKDQGIEFSEEEDVLPNWTRTQLRDHVNKGNSCLIMLDGYVVDATSYLSEHVRVLLALCGV